MLLSSRSLTTSVIAASTLWVSASALVQAADWPQWRGEGRANHSPDANLLKEWPKDGPKQVWLYKDAGLGYSGPSVVDGKLFTMGARDGKTHVLCLDATKGEELWSRELDTALENGWGNGPRATPTVDGDRVYALGGRGKLVCLQVSDGKEVWSAHMVDDFGGEVPNWGYTESVLVDGDRLICTPGGERGSVVALDKGTGKKIWQSEGLKVAAHYASPILVEHAGVRQYIQLFQKDFAGFEAETGKVLWQADFPKGQTAVIPTPIYHDGIVYVTAGYSAGCKAIKLGPNHEVETLYEKEEISNHHGGVVLVDGYLYGYHSNRGGWQCQELATGEIKWSDRALGKGAVSYADGHLYCLGEKDGEVVLADASPEGWKESGRFKLEPQSEIRSDRGAIWVHPVILDGRLYLRDQDLIYCYDVSAQ